MSILKFLFKGFCALLALSVVVVLGVLSYNAYRAYTHSVAAHDAADAFCDDLLPGSPIEPMLTRAQTRHLNVVALPNGGYEIQFLAWIGSWACQVRTSDEKITTTTVVSVQ
jgi:hypothetical protein